MVWESVLARLSLLLSGLLVLSGVCVNSYFGPVSTFRSYRLFGKKNRTVPTNIVSGKQEPKPIRQKSYGIYMQVYGNPNFKNYEEAIQAFRAKIAMSGREEILDSKPERFIPRHMILRKLRQTRGFKISAYQRERALIRATEIDNNNNIRNVFYRQLPTILGALNSYQEFLDKNHGGTESFLAAVQPPKTSS